MKRCCLRCVAVLMVFSAVAVCSTRAGAQSSQRSYIDREVIVKLDDSTLPYDVAQLRSSLQATVKQRFQGINAELWQINGISVEEAVTRFQNDWRLDYIEPNYVVRALDVFPNDVRFNELWGMHNTGQTGGTADADIDAPEAWSLGTGGDVLVGVIDTGVDWHHVDLAANIFTNPNEIAGNGIDDDGNGYTDDVRGWDFVNNDNDPVDDHGHGTHVSGTIAAVGNNGIGVAGVSWSARILPLKFLDSGGFGSTAAAILAVEYATGMGARLTNNSWGGGGFSNALRDAIQAAGAQGILFVAAAGNDGINTDSFPHYPSSYDLDNIISVASTDHDDLLSWFSNYGVASVDLAAPGSDILSTFPNNTYGSISGTSMATPHVSGAISLLWSLAPLMTRTEVKDAIMTSVDPLQSLAGRVMSGGRLNVFSMLSNLDDVPPARVGDLAVQSTGSTTARLTWTATGDDGTVGTASRYDIRYSKSGIYWSNFNSATPAAGEPQPNATGSAESFEVTGLEYNTKYYFAMVVEDEQGNRSPLSSLPNGTTLGAPRIAYAPGSFAVDLHTGGKETRTLTIENTGAGTLDFVALSSPSWVSLDPASGRVAAGGSMPVDVRFDATYLAGGSHAGTITLGTNDVLQPSVPLGVNLQVTAAPDVTVSPPSLDFGAHYTGTCSPDTLVVTNIGTVTLQVSGVSTSNPAFTASPGGFSLGPNQSIALPVMFCPTLVAGIQATLSIASDDPDHPSFDVPLAGEGVAPPVIAVSPPSLSADLFTGGQSDQVLSISNQGGSNLDLEITLEEAGGAAQAIDVFAGATTSPDILAVGRPLAADEIERMKRDVPRELRVDSSGEIDRGKPFTKRDGAQMTLDRIGSSLEEVFGSPENMFSAGMRTRGNLFTCTTSTVLREHRFFLNPYQSTDLWFLVYEGLTQVGTYALISASNVAPAGPGTGWYSSGDVDVDMEAGRFYLIVASFEEIADYFNDTDVLPYPYPASFGELTGGAGWSWAPPTSFPPNPFQDVPDWAFGEPVAYYQTLVTGGAVRWLSLNPEAGTVPPAGTLQVAVTFDATRQFGGDYDANIRIASNDPVTPEVVVPAHLHVTGAPDITLSTLSIDYGPQFIGAAVKDTLVVSNTGTDLLTVTGIATGHPDYTVNITAFSLPPTGEQEVVVTYAPTTTGPHPASLTVQSDDPDEPTIIVALAGTGVEPPIIAVSPQSLTEDLLTGGTSTQTLNISNSGESALTFDIGIENVSGPTSLTAGTAGLEAGGATTRDITPAASPARSQASARSWHGDRPPSRAAAVSATAPVLTSISGLRVLLIRTSDVTEIRDILMAYPDIIAVDEFDGYSATPTLNILNDYHAVILINGYAFADSNALGNVLADYVDDGGAVIMTLASFISGWEVGGRFASDGYYPFTLGSGPLGNAVLASFNAAHPIMAGVNDAAGDLLGATTVAPGAEWVAGWTNGQPCVATQGNHVVGVNVFLEGGGYWAGDIPLILHNAVVWATGAAWLRVEPAQGVVPPHANMNIAVRFDAGGLFGGDYLANIAIANNDPLNPNVVVPAALHVTGAPDIALSDTAFDYGVQFVGAAIQKTLVVSNDGTDLLTVSSLVSSHPDYSVDTPAFTLAPAQSRNVVVTFSPTSTGPISGSLTITSDDFDEGVLVVSLTGAGVPPPIGSVTPASLSEDLITGETATRSLTISNSGESALSFNIAVEDLGGPALSASREAGPAQAIEPLEIAKGGTDTRSYPPMTRASGGPDASGYRWRDNNDPGGPVFSWIDASSGTSVSLSDDSFAPGIPLGFTFDYYGTEFTTIGVCSNGWLSFNGPGGWFPTSVPSSDGMPGAIAAFARDLYPPGASYVRYKTVGTAPRRQFVVEYNNIPDYGGGSYKTFEMILSEGTNSVRFQYLTVVGAPYGFGIESLDETTGIGNAGVGDLYLSPALVRNGYAIEFSVGPAWLTLDTQVGVVPPHGSVVIAAMFDAAGLYGGNYDANVRIATNDPIHPELAVPVDLQVTGAPDIEVPVSALDYGTVFVGANVPRPLVIVNAGTDMLTISSIASSHPYFTASPSAFQVSPGDTASVVVTFAPVTAGAFAGSLTITSDDPDEAAVLVGLEGIALEPPVIAVSPSSFSEALFTGETSTQVLTVSNLGTSPLEFDIARVRELPAATMAAGMPAAGSASRHAAADGMEILRSDAPQQQEPIEPSVAAESTQPAVLVIQDYAAWYYGLQDLLLTHFGVPSTVINSNQIAGTDFANYDLIVTAGFQTASYYNALTTHRAKFSQFVNAGGFVQYDGATNGSSFELAGGVLCVYGAFSYLNTITAPSHPIAAGLPPNLEGYYASHNQIAAFPADATVITQTSATNLPTTVEYRHGAGTVIATGMTWEYLYYYGYPGGQMLVNALGYALAQAGVPWLDTNPAAGTVAPGQSMNVSIRFDANGLVGGLYEAFLRVRSNDPANSLIDVPVSLGVTGAPNIVVSPSSLAFGTVFIGGSQTQTVHVSNTGTDYLVVTPITSSLPQFVPDPNAIAVPPGGSQDVVVTFAPTATGALNASLTLQSNDPNQPVVNVSMTGSGATPPVITISPTSLTESLLTGGSSVQSLTLGNVTGGAPLTWSVYPVFPGSTASVIESAGAMSLTGVVNFEKDDRHPPAPRPDTERIFTFSARSSAPAAAPERSAPAQIKETPGLEEVLARLNARHGDVIARVPPLHDFSQGVTGSHILDGGGDMYDGGNRLGTDRGRSIEYSDNAIVAGTAFGTAGRYFTRKYPGLFVLAADLDAVDYFEITDNLGADGRGKVDGAVLEVRLGGQLFHGFVKRVHGAGVPSVNHLIIVNENAAASHEFSTFTDDDYHRAFNLSQSRRLYYLLFATEDGGRVDDDAMLDVMRSFLAGIGMVSEWVNVAPSSGTVAAGASVTLGATFNASGLFGGDYHADLYVSSNDPANPEMVIPVDLHVTGVPDISVTPSLLYYGQVPVGVTVKQYLLVANEGSEQLTVSNVTSTSPNFVPGATNFVLAPGQSTSVEVSFTATSLGTIFGQLTVTSDDPDEGAVSLYAVGEGTEPPVISVSPASISDIVAPGEIATHQVNISNSGVGNLNVNVRLVETGGTSTGWSQSASVVVTKRPGPDPSGGPDPFGYRWKDSDDPGGPAFSWASVATGANVGLLDDGFMAGIPLGFSFRYYDVEYTTIGVGSNGWLSFNGSGSGYPASVPLADGFAGAIAPYARNLYPPSAGYVRYQTFGVAPNRQFVIEYNSVPLVGLAGAVTFEVILTESVNSIRFQYLSVTAAPFGFGIESPDQLRGMGNGGSGDLFIPSSRVRTNYAIEFSPAPRWLGATPTTATLRTGEFVDIVVSLDARNLSVGDYAGRVSIFSNDPLHPLIDVPVTLTVDSVAVAAGVRPVPVSFALEPNRPNPFNPITTIAYDLPQGAKVHLVIYDVAGRQVRELVNGSQPAGRREVVWDGRNASGDFVSSGVYFYRLVAGDFVQTRKMVLLK